MPHKASRIPAIRFFNTFEPVTTIYRDLGPALLAEGIAVEFLLSASEYRVGRACLEEAVPELEPFIRRIPPRFARVGTRFRKSCVNASYAAFAGALSLGNPTSAHNVFLTQPPLFMNWGRFLKRIRRQAFGVVLMDLYPDVAIEAGLLRRNGGMARLLKKLSRKTLRAADFVVVIGRCMQEELRSFGVDSDRIILIPNWVDQNHIVPVPRKRNRLAQELGIKDSLVIEYSGNMGVSHDFGDLIEVCRRFREDRSVLFLLIGNGARLPAIARAKESHGLQNLTILPPQPQSRLPESLSLGDVHFVSLRKAFDGLVVPSKAYGAFAAGRPVLYQGSEFGEIARLIQEHGIGSVVAPGDTDGLEAAIRDYQRNPNLLVEQGRLARNVTEQQHSREISCGRYVELLKSFCRC